MITTLLDAKANFLEISLSIHQVNKLHPTILLFSQVKVIHTADAHFMQLVIVK
jgi:hypothetical protein